MKLTTTLRWKVRRFSILLIITSCLAISSDVAAQENMTKDMLPFRGPEVTQSASSEPLKPLYAPHQPIYCEDLRGYLDEAILRWHELQGTYLIVIARPGTGEKAGSLGRIRLRQVEIYLRQRYEGKINYLLAEGSRVDGLGRIEVYVGGKLLAMIPVPKRAAAICYGKVNPFL
jgi:hypothetical protein